MYIQGFLIPVKTGNRDAYRAMAAKAAPLFEEYGAIRIVETWGDDVMRGKVTDMWRAVDAQDGEALVFSWILWPDKATCDKGAETMQADERMKPDGDVPFDMARMIYGGFEPVFDSGGGGGRFGYVDGMVATVADADRQRFADHAARMAGFFTQNGALRVVDGWGADVPDGKVTDFKRAVQAKDGETVIFGWVEWPDKATRDACWGAMMADPRMRDDPPPWNGQTAIFGGFTPLLDTDHD